MASAISGYINQIRTAVYGEQVRGAIVSALEACYSDVENPDLQSAAFYTAILQAYDQGILDIIQVTKVSQMTNQNIIYRYMGNETGYTSNTLYYYNGTMWAPIGSGVRTAATAALMTDTSAIYKYTGSETGYITNALYYYNGSAWVPISTPTDKTLSKSNEPADSAVVGTAFEELFSILTGGEFENITWTPGAITNSGTISAPGPNGEVYSDRIRATAGMNINLELTSEENKSQWLAVAFYGENGFISRNVILNAINTDYYSSSVQCPEGTEEFAVSFRSFGGDVTVSIKLDSNNQAVFEAFVELLPLITYGSNPKSKIKTITNLLGIETEPEEVDIPASSVVNQSIEGGHYTGNSLIRKSYTPAAVHLSKGDVVTITPTASAGISYMGIQGFISASAAKTFDSGWIHRNAWPYTFTLIDNAENITGFGLTFAGEERTEDVTNETVSIHIKITGSITDDFYISIDPHDEVIKGIAHRGYSTEAPENTLPAYKLAKKNGFNYAECDLLLTSDNIPVLIHDTTINRTSNGTGSVSSMTFEQLQTYDFGSWKSATYAGTKIPSFEQFIVLCKRIGLHPYIELKTEASWNQEKVTALIETLNRYSMKEKATFISFGSSLLNYVKTADDSIRLGYVVRSLSEAEITVAQNLKTANNEVFIDTNEYTAETLAAAIAAGIPVEMWYGDTTTAAIASLDNYITGVTNNDKLAGQIIYDNSI